MNKQQQAKARRRKAAEKGPSAKGEELYADRTEIPYVRKFQGMPVKIKLRRHGIFPHPCNGKCGERTAVFPTCKPGLFWTDYKKINAME